MSILNNLFLVLLLLLTVSCTNEKLSKEKIQFEKAKTDLNNKNYLRANSRLRKLVSQSPNNIDYNLLLADSYLGMGGFELMGFLVSLERLLFNSFSEENFLKEVKKFTEKYILFNKSRVSNISKALIIYNKINIYEVDSRESYLKKGLVHTFLFTQSLKDFVIKVQKNRYFKRVNDFKGYRNVLKKYKSEFDGIVKHLFKAYVNFKESFGQVENLLVEIDRAIYRLVGKPYNEIKEELEDLTLEKFVNILMKYNPDLYEIVMKNIFDTCERNDALKKLELILEDIRNDNREYLFLEKTVLGLISYVERHEGSICSMDY